MRFTKLCLIFICAFLFSNIRILAQSDDIEIDDSTSVGWDDGTTGGLIIKLQDPVTIKANNLTMVYGDKLPEFTYSTEGAALEGQPEIICEATSTSPVGEYPIIIRKGSIKNYNTTYVNGVLTITKSPLNIKAKSYSIKQGQVMPTFEAEYTGFKNNETNNVFSKQPSFTCSATSGSALGKYDIIVSGAEAKNYAISYTKGTLTITEADPVKITAKSYTREYGDANPTFEYSVEGATLDGTPEIICEATATSPVGDYPIIIRKGSIKNYNTTYVNGVLTITKSPLSIKAKSYSIKQGQVMPTFEAEYTGFKNNETYKVLSKQPSFTCSATSGSPLGKYDIMVGGAEAKNYAISYTKGTLTITEADPVKVTAKSYTREYGDANPTFEYSVEGATLDGTPEIVCEATATSPVGEYPIIIKKGSVKNYNDTYINGVLTITKAPLTVSVGNYTKKQGEANPEFTLSYNGFKNNETKDVLTKQPNVNCGATTSSAPGEYPITVSGAEAENYNISYTNGKLTVVQADAVVITAKSYTREYGEANPTFEYSVEGATLEGTPEIICEATATSPVGEYPIIIKKGSVKNYNDTYVNGVLTITKAPLTVSVGNYTKKQGEANPEFSLSYSGFKNNETEAVLKKKPTATTTATESSAPGEYDIVVSGGEAENYSLSYKNGKLTIVKADAIVITAKSYSREYGEANPTFEYTVEGAVLDGQPEIICEATATSPVGEYPIIIKKGSVKNYNDTYVNGVLTITKAPLTISVGNYEKKQYDPMPEFVLSYDGFKNDETEDVLIKQPTVSCEANEDSAPGEYAIVVKGAEARNYEIKYVSGKLTVTEPDSYTLTYMVDGEVYQSFSVKYRDAITPLDAPEKEGYTFSGWSEIPETMPAKDVTVIGTFTINSYTLTYIVDGEEYKSFTVKFREAITPLEAPTKEGYTFSGWDGLPRSMPAKDVVVKGSFTINKYKLTYMVDGVEYKSYEINYATAITPEAEPTKEGYTFSGWSEIPETMPANDVVVTGTFTVNSYIVRFMYRDEVLYTEEVNYGDSIPLPELYDDYGLLIKWLDVPETMPAHDIVILVDETDAVLNIQGKNKDYIKIYDLNGHRLASPQKGINIIRYSDGTSRKVMIK